MPRRTAPFPAAAVAWLCALAACTSPVVVVPPETDAAVAETVLDAEVDGTDPDLDVVTDVVDAMDTPDADSDSDADVSPDVDVPYWIAHDIDIAGLGVVTDGGYCGDIYLKVQPGDPPQGPGCASACPAPYPCTCGTCPWIQTPPMLQARFGAQALWTGEEVLVFGGGDGLGSPFTAERWNPSKNDGFQPITLPFVEPGTPGTTGPWFRAFWTGTEAVVIMDKRQFTFDPTSGVVKLVPLPPIVRTPVGAIVWTGESLYWWGGDSGPNDLPHIAAWRHETGWVDMPFPSDYLLPSPIEPPCITTLDGDIYVFDPKSPRNPAAGFDPEKAIMLRFSAAATTWTALAQTSGSDLHCNKYADQLVLFKAFPDGIALIPEKAVSPTSRGAIWWRSTQDWSPIGDVPFESAYNQMGGTIWANGSFVLIPGWYTDPVTAGMMFDTLPTPVPIAADWPLTFDPYSGVFGYLTSVGFPKHDQASMAWTWTGKELFAFGGINGIGANDYHTDGVRLPFPMP